MMPAYLTTRDVLHSPSLWPPDVRVLERMWALEPRRPWERKK